MEAIKNNNSFYIENINYNAKGQRTLVKFGNGTETLYFYDNKTFRLIQLKTIRTANGTSLQDLCYTYDPAGNVVEIVDQAQETSYYNNSQIEPCHLYVYDALYRLLSGTGRELLGLAKATAGGYATDSVNAADAQALHNFTQHFEYDALGNILEIQHVTPNSTLNWTRQYVYDTATNRLLKHDTQQTLNDYTYDSHGNITTMPHLPQMQWTFDDKLKEATLNAGGDKAYYVYDSAGNRTRKVVEKGIIREERFYLNNYEVYRKYSSNTLTVERTTAHIMDDKQRIATIDHETGGQTTVRYQVNNHLGSSSIELDESGVILTYEEYHPFGTTAYQKHNTNISQKRYKYVGKERDEETGLYNYGFRLYAPWLCRFVSVDPLQHKYPHYTPYQYAGNKPITFIDLDGLEEYIPGSDRADATNKRMQSIKAFKEEAEHIDKTLNKLNFAKLGLKPLDRDHAHELFNTVKNSLMETNHISGDFKSGYKFDSKSWIHQNANPEKVGKLEPGTEKWNNLQEQMKSARSNAENQIKNSPFFSRTPPDIQIYQLPMKDGGVDWGGIGNIVDWIGTGVESTGLFITAIPGGQFFGLVATGVGKGVSLVGTGMQIYDAAKQEEKKNLYVILGATALSELSSIPINKLVSKNVLDLTDKAILETQKNVFIQYTEGQITK